MQYSYTRYLSAKKTVDDRALNKDVVAALRPLVVSGARILELGAGLGTMVARLIEWNVLREADYTLVDMDAELLADSRSWLQHWSESRGFSCEENSSGLALRGGDVHVQVRFVHADLRDFLRRTDHSAWDVLVANAFLDLVDVRAMLPQLFRLLHPGGTWWFTINFDGDTILEPEHPFDEQYLRRYHEGMDTRSSGGHSRTGRRLFAELRACGAEIAAAGSSDWVVYPPYPGDEGYFLQHILHTIDEGIRPDASWLWLRRDQVERGELVYIAHQIDFVGRYVNGAS